jgi:transcriptional regulator with XRE-family HTH domain
MAVLDRRLIASRRAALGLSRHDLAQATGLATGAIEHIETRGRHDDLQLSAAIQLAAALAIPIADLLQPAQPDHAAIRGHTAVEALLAERRQPTAAEDLAATLGWTLARTLAALRALDRRLSGTGQALQRLPVHRYALVPAMNAVSQSQRRDAARRQLRRLDVATARVLHRIVCGARQDRRWNAYTNVDRRHLAQLVNLGLVHDVGGHLEISAELMENLGLRQPPEGRRTDDATDKRMTESADAFMTEPLKSQ